MNKFQNENIIYLFYSSTCVLVIITKCLRIIIISQGGPNKKQCKNNFY